MAGSLVIQLAPLQSLDMRLLMEGFVRAAVRPSILAVWRPAIRRLAVLRKVLCVLSTKCIRIGLDNAVGTLVPQHLIMRVGGLVAVVLGVVVLLQGSSLRLCL